MREIGALARARKITATILFVDGDVLADATTANNKNCEGGRRQSWRELIWSVFRDLSAADMILLRV